VPEPAPDNGTVDVAALFAQLQDEVRRSAPRGTDGGTPASPRAGPPSASGRSRPIGTSAAEAARSVRSSAP
jgi:hypothetical protein